MAIIELTHYRLIDIQGEDAEKYLQGQLTCDLYKLLDGASTLTAHCDPKGKTNAIFRLIRISAQQFYAVVHQSLLDIALLQLRKYAVFSKVTFTPQQAQLIGVIEENIQLSAQVKVNFANRELLINPQLDEKISAALSQDTNQWDIADIQQGYPILTDKTHGEFIPQALNLDNIEQAISFQKGCYIGQETVARAKYRGANKRAMFAFSVQIDSIDEISSDLALEIQLENGWRKTGDILTAVFSEGTFWLQAVLNNDVDKSMKFRLAGELKEKTLSFL